MNFIEFQAGIERAAARLLGSQLQDFTIEDRDLVLLFYSVKPIALRISLKTPPVLFFEAEAFKLGSDSRSVPMALFLARHFLRKKVTEVKSRDEWGRRFEIYFDKLFYMDIVLVPGFQNVGLFADDKSLYLQKPRALPESVSESRTEVSDFRSLDQIREEWYADVKKNPKAPIEKDWKQDLQKKIRKKTEAIQKIIQQSQENEIAIQQLYKVGELLKYKSVQDLGDEDRQWIQERESKDWNREQVFKKAKSLSSKKDGMVGRIKVLQSEILELNDALEGVAPEPKHKNSIAGKASVDTRKLEVDNTLSLYMGKNAQDNVKLLKSSQPWELWFHLKDYPSAYAITRKSKGVPVGHAELVKMASWFAKECFKNKKEKLPPYIEVIYTECRFVKLLKGDHLGRVTHTNAKTLRVSIT